MSHKSKNIEEIREELIKGYREMSEINLEEANSGLESDSESLRIYEQHLTECE